MRGLQVMGGGLDSQVLQATHPDDIARAVTFDYGQARGDIIAARDISKKNGVKWRKVDLGQTFRLANAALVTGAVPLNKAWNDVAQEATVVPFRNGIFAAVAVMHAQLWDCDEVVLGCQNNEPGSIYADSSPEFVDEFSDAARAAAGVTVSAPFVSKSKADIIELGAEHNVAMELSWSCWLDGQMHCGRCGACDKRRAGFAETQVLDPTKYLVDQEG